MFCMMLALAGGPSLRAQNPLVLTGEPQWRIENKVCKFSLTGATRLVNTGPEDYLSGSLRLVLWLRNDPRAPVGYDISGVDLGQLQGGYEIADVEIPAPVVYPKVSGFWYLSLTLDEFATGGFVQLFTGSSQVVYLRDGVPGAPPLWKPPTGRVLPAPAGDPSGKKVVLIQKAVQAEGKAYIVPKLNQYSLGAKLTRSGRTAIFFGNDPKGFGTDWSYKEGRAKWGGKTHGVGVLEFDQGVIQGKRFKSTYWLFFQKNGRGFFKGTHVTGSQSATNWGTFTLG
jgi:hypothetical protein